jgi:hypothetical protein
MRGAGYGLRDAGLQLLVYFVVGCGMLVFISSQFFTYNILNPKSLKLKNPNLKSRKPYHETRKPETLTH